MGKSSTFAKRLRELLDIRGWTQTELATRSKVSKASISHYLKGDWEAKQDVVFRIAQEAGVDEAWLMGYDVPMDKSIEDLLWQTAKDAAYNQEFNELTEDEKIRVLASVKKLLPPNILPVPTLVKKPRLGNIACGKPILAVEDAEEFDMVPENIECDFTLRCKGDSMINARIFDGDIVYIRIQPEVENGEIAAVRIGDEATLKKVYYTPGSDRITLRACNPMYPDLVYDGETLNEIEILGKAVAFTSIIKY